MQLVPHHGPVHHVILHHGILHHKTALTVTGIVVLAALVVGGFALAKRGTTVAGPAAAQISAWSLHMAATLADMPVLKVDEPY
jgi:hypothetical protein